MRIQDLVRERGLPVPLVEDIDGREVDRSTMEVLVDVLAHILDTKEDVLDIEGLDKINPFNLWELTPFELRRYGEEGTPLKFKSYEEWEQPWNLGNNLLDDKTFEDTCIKDEFNQTGLYKIAGIACPCPKCSPR
jgi:hypothetical protein